jgi:hypothetical protein
MQDSKSLQKVAEFIHFMIIKFSEPSLDSEKDLALSLDPQKMTRTTVLTLT